MNSARFVTPHVGTALLLAAGLAGGYWWASRTHVGGAEGPGTNATAGREVLYWFDPMVPDRHFEKPGKSPFMDMQLVPKYADGGPADGVRISAEMQQSVGIR